MVRLLKALLFLLIVGFVGLVGFAYLGDLDPMQSDVTQTRRLNVD